MASVDSIVLKLHDLELHSTILDELYFESKHSKTVYGKNVETNERLQRVNLKTWIEYTRYGDTGEEKVKFHFNKIPIPSSHYFLVYKIDLINDCIVFNFSVPKYLYGNNIAQFVTTNVNPSFNFPYHSDRMNQRNSGAKRIQKFIKYFFKKEFPEHKVSYKHIEIDRIDLCYNQYFKSKEDALQYLEMQKKITKKGTHENSRGVKHFKAGITVNTTSKYYKIYHKGSEYEKGDVTGIRNKSKDEKHNQEILRKIKSLETKYNLEYKEWQLLGGNKQKRFAEPSRLEYKKKVQKLRNKLVDVNFLQKESDKILRYEITLRGRWLSYIYTRKVYRKKCPKWQILFENYNYINSQTRGGTELNDRIEVKAKRSLLDIHKQEVEEEYQHLINQGIVSKKTKPTKEPRYKYVPKFEKHEIKFYNNFKKQLEERKYFYLEVERSVLAKAKRYDPLIGSYGIGEKTAYFSNELYIQCANELYKFIDQFQIKEVPSDLTIEQKIDDYNKDIAFRRKQFEHLKLTQKDAIKYDVQKLNKSNLLLVVSLLKEKSLDEIKAEGIYSKSAFYRVKKQLEKIGITKQTVMTDKVAFDSMILPKTNYSDYYERLNFAKSEKKLPYFGGNYNIAFHW